MASDLLPRARTGPLPPPVRQRPRDLPAWPIVLLFAGFGLFWVLGLSAFAVAICSIPMMAMLAVRGNVAAPRGFLLWILFVVWACVSGIEIEAGSRVIGFAVRMVSYIGATVVFLYIYNSSRRTLSERRVLLAIMGFLLVTIVGGWLGVLSPRTRLTTPVSLVIPNSLLDNDYVRQLVKPSFAEVQQPYGSPQTFTRPSAPFAYTNGWGCNFSLLVPCAVAAFSDASRRMRVALCLLLATAVVPALATLNRGMFAALIFGALYAAIRYAVRGKFAPIAVLAATGVAATGVVVASGFLGVLTARLHYSETNIGRLTTYQEAFNGTLQSPIFGNGSPRPSNTLSISIGTQGQLWNIMYSYGFVALAAYLGWFLYAAYVSRSAPTGSMLWMHVVLVVVVLTTFYYGYDGPQLAVGMVAAALVMRPREPA